MESFHERLMSEMRQRVAEVMAGALPDVNIDLEQLEEEQGEREGTLKHVLERARDGPQWSEVMKDMAEVEAIFRARKLLP